MNNKFLLALLMSAGATEYRQHKWVQRADGKWVLTGGAWVSLRDKVAGKQ